MPLDGAGQDLFEKDVLIHDQVPAAAGGLIIFGSAAESLKKLSYGTRGKEIEAWNRREYRLEEGDARHVVGMASRIIEGERAAPVVTYEDDVRKTECINEPLHIATVVDKAILNVGFVGLAEPDQINGNDSPLLGQVRDDVPPEVHRCRLAMQQQERPRARAFVNVVQL